MRGNVNEVDKGELKLKNKLEIKLKYDSLLTIHKHPIATSWHFPAKQGRIQKITINKKSFPSLRGNVDAIDKGELKLDNESSNNSQAPHRPCGALPRKAGKD